MPRGGAWNLLGHPVSNSNMAWKGRREVVLKLVDAALFLGAAASVAFLLLYGLPYIDVTSLLQDAAAASALLFLCASILVCIGRRLGYPLGVIAGLVGLAWFVRIESWRFESLWVALNLPKVQVVLVLGIMSVALIVVATACASLRCLPPRLSLGKSALCRRTWPAFGIGFLVMGLWFMNSVTPYRVPIIVDGVRAELRILHVKKRGLRFQETAVIAYHDSRFYVWRNDRKLFEYRFDWRSAQGVMPQGARAHVRALVDSPQLRMLHTPPAEPLRRWNAEGWYVVVTDRQLWAFTSEPPPEIKDVFHEILNLPIEEDGAWAKRDVCLGFCYGPVAALGFQYPNEPCFALTGGTTRCR